jgi:hypothetical protein
MPRELPTTSRPGLVVPVRTARDGLPGPTKDEVRGPRWRRTTRGRYVPSSVSTDHVQQRILEASMVVPKGGAVTGWAALAWLGARWFSGQDAVGRRLPVTLVISTFDIRPQPGIELSGEGLDPALVEVVDGVPVTDPRYSVSYLMRYAPSPWAAVVAAEMAFYDDLLSLDELTAFVTPGQNAWTGVPRAREALGWCQENSWSPREPAMRRVWEVVAGRPRPLCNAPVFDLAGHHLGTPDLIDPTTGVTGEYDGDHHLDRPQRDRDLRREGLLRAHGLEPVVMIGPDLGEPSAFLARLDTAYARAEERAHRPRSWTLDQPAWWVPTETVAQRRALTEDQRRRFLRHRSA